MRGRSTSRYISLLTRLRRASLRTTTMKYLIILGLGALASSARLDHKIHLPPNAKSSSGAAVGLQAPYSSPGAFGGRSQNLIDGSSGKSQAQILRFENEINEEGYHYAYETSDGTKAEQEGRVSAGAGPEEGSLAVVGSYQFVGADGRLYAVSYTADERGFRAEGAHLPTPPPAAGPAGPAARLRSLQLAAATGAHYDSPRSSYDADAAAY